MSLARFGGLLLIALILHFSAHRCLAQAVSFDDPGVRLTTGAQAAPDPADQDAQAATGIENLLDQIPNDVVEGGGLGLLGGAATLMAMEIASAGTVTIPLAVAVLSSGAFLGIEAATSHAIDNLATVLQSIGDDD